jgi:hypothetical protein
VQVADVPWTSMLVGGATSSAAELQAMVLVHMGHLKNDAIPVAWDLRPTTVRKVSVASKLCHSSLKPVLADCEHSKRLAVVSLDFCKA